MFNTCKVTSEFSHSQVSVFYTIDLTLICSADLDILCVPAFNIFTRVIFANGKQPSYVCA